MHRRPTRTSRMLDVLTPGTDAWVVLLLGVLFVIVDMWIAVRTGLVQVDPHLSAGFIAWHNQNPLVDWTMSGNGAEVGLFGHRVAFGSYGSWVPFMSPNGGRYIDIFGHHYGFELWGHFGPFMDTD